MNRKMNHRSRPTLAKLFESLEARQLLSATFDSSTRVLSVFGTNANDSLVIDRQFNTLQVSDNSATYSFDANQVRTIYLYGNDGNDTMTLKSSVSIPAVMYGGNGNDLLTGGGGNDSLYGQTNNDILRGGGGNDILDGGVGLDEVRYDEKTRGVNVSLDGKANDGERRVLINLKTGEVIDLSEKDNVLNIENIWGSNYSDRLSGNSLANALYGLGGDDYLFGGDGDDSLRGSAGKDSIYGSNGNDAIFGDEDSDMIYGEAGNDVLEGNDGNDRLYGGYGNDLLRGGNGSDELSGEGDNDSLYGGNDSDYLFGNDGVDGLYGGAGTDYLSGGAGSDRFLDRPDPVWGMMGAIDRRMDYASEDAMIGVSDSPQTTVDFAGQSGSYTFAAGSFSDREIEVLDSALGVLHQATGNRKLVSRANGGVITFRRAGSQIASSGGSFSAAAWNSDGAITLANGTFSSDRFTREVVLHEIGHNWDEEYNAGKWRDQSGWTRMLPFVSELVMPSLGYVKAADSSGLWWYKNNAKFVSNYARTNPNEDFAETFSAYFMNRSGWTFGGGGTSITDTSGGMTNKRNFFNGLVNDMARA